MTSISGQCDTMHGGTATGDRDYAANDDEEGENIIKVGNVCNPYHFPLSIVVKHFEYNRMMHLSSYKECG